MNTLLQNVSTQNLETIEILKGADVVSLVSDQEFGLQWDELYASCPWATVFQSRSFVATWYQSYHQAYLPLLVKATQGERLIGLLTLAQDKKGQIIGAGANQAEYQVWLSTPDHHASFIKKALAATQRAFPQSKINLVFVPDKTPLDWIETDTVWQKSCFLRKVKQPLLVLNKENLSQELRKKNRREKINRLKRLGELSFERITDRLTFFSVLDELAVQSDFRKGAMYNKLAFQEDTHRKEFLRNLFDENLLHVTLLKIGDTIVASNVGVTGQNWVHLQGINTHSPVHARHSPGILHFLMLGVMLAEEAMEVFDLTPGSNAYKDALATDFTTATELVIGTPSVIQTKKLSHGLTEYIKKNLPRLGIEQQQLKNMGQQAAVLKAKAKLIKGQNIRLVLRHISNSSKLRSYLLAPVNDRVHNRAIPLQIDDLEALLNYRPLGSLTSKWEFLIDAMRRLETGQHAYTWQENGRLLGCAWLSEPKASKPTAIAKMNISPEALVLHSFYCPSLDQEQTYEFIKAIVAGITETSGKQQVYAVTFTYDRAVCEALEALQTTETTANK